MLLLLVCAANAFGQMSMTVKGRYAGKVEYGGHDRPVNSLSELPLPITANLQGHLRKVLGSFSDSLVFEYGQTVDLDQKFLTDSLVHGYDYVLPAYDLVFRLSYLPIGIETYYLRVELDRYGQLLAVNWPREGHDDPGRFRDLASVQDFAVNRAKAGEFYSEGYKASLEHNRNLDKLCWIFQFPVEGKPNMYRAIDIPWTLLEVVDEHWILETYSHGKGD